MNPYQVIKTVRVTEKAQILQGDDQYTFMVDPGANKTQIRKAVEQLFDRQVAAVNVINVRGKTGRRTRYGVGKKSDFKKAVVTLKEGQEPLELF